VNRSLLASQVFSVSLALAAAACTSDASAPQGGSGGQGTGGATGSGGKVGSGGAASGGVAGSVQSSSGGSGAGGSSETGGRTGGSTGTGGRSATGGTTSGPAGGSTSRGGSTGSGGTTTLPGTGGSSVAGNDGGGAGVGAGGTGPAEGGRSSGDGGPGREVGPTGSGGSGAGGQTGGAGGRGDASPSTGGTGGGTGYNPCKASPCIILPLGDSITHGVNSTDSAGYRSQLFKLVVAANQNVTFTGSQSSGPSTVSNKTFPKNHEGHDGYTVESGYSTYGTAGISSLIPSPAFNTKPDIVLLHIGTNDLTSSNAKSTTSDRLDKVLTSIVAAAPNALVVVAKVIPLGYSSSDWDTYNSKIPGVVQKHTANGEHMVVVDMSKLPASQLGGVHPTDQGYATMAGYWYDAIKEFLP
jgi:lysophospholipase L1-like esterase